MQALVRAAEEKFGADLVAYGAPPNKKQPPDFAVRLRGERSSAWASGLSDVWHKLPESPDEYVLADAEIRDDVRRWLEANREEILGEAYAAEIREAKEGVK